MSSASQVLSGIEAARSAVKQATQAWEPASLSQVRAALRALEDSLPLLEASFAGIPANGQLPVERLRNAAQALRDEAAALEFLVDAAAAFVRAAAGTGTGQSYNPAGEIRLDRLDAGEKYTG